MNDTIAIIQARTGSTRLPNKVMLKLEGKTVLEHIIKRVGACPLIDKVFVATTTNSKDIQIVKLCATLRTNVYRGSEIDVLDRYFQVAKLSQANHIVRITADCPLIDPVLMAQVIKFYFRSKADYVSNAIQETFPDGEDMEIFTFKALHHAWLKAKLPSEREHVTPYIRNNPKIFKVKDYASKTDLSNKRWTLDHPEDYRFVKTVYKNLYKENPIFGMEEVLKLLKQKPKIEKLNQNHIRNEGYLTSLQKDKNKNAKTT